MRTPKESPLLLKKICETNQAALPSFDFYNADSHISEYFKHVFRLIPNKNQKILDKKTEISEEIAARS